MRAGAGARVMSASSSGGRPPAYDPAAAAAEAWQAPLRDICAAAAAAGCGPPTLARLAASRLLLTAPVACLRVCARASRQPPTAHVGLVDWPAGRAPARDGVRGGAGSPGC